MEKSNIFEFFTKIFSDSPKSPKSIPFELEVLNDLNIKDETKLSDIFEIFLHMFIFGLKKLNLGFTEESIFILKQYFTSLDPSVKFNIEIVEFDTILFKSPQYLTRYCVIDPSSLKDIEPLFIMNYNKLNRSKLSEFTAVYQDEYESMMFINFDFN